MRLVNTYQTLNTKLASLPNVNNVISDCQTVDFLFVSSFIDHLCGQGGECVGTYDYSLFCIINYAYGIM